MDRKLDCDWIEKKLINNGLLLKY